MDLQAFAPLLAAGMSWTEIARLAGCDWRTAKKYLMSPEPPAYASRPVRPRLMDAYTEIVDVALKAEPFIRATTVFERLVAEPYGFPGSYHAPCTIPCRLRQYVLVKRNIELRFTAGRTGNSPDGLSPIDQSGRSAARQPH